MTTPPVASPARTPARPRPLLYLHIPKTAGTSFSNAMAWHFTAQERLHNAHYAAHLERDPNDYQLVMGHIQYNYLARYRTRPTVVTVLRDPLERSLSTYYFFREMGEEGFRRDEGVAVQREVDSSVRMALAARRYDLPEFLDAEPDLAAHYLGNLQTQYLAGCGAKNPTAQDLPAALRNLTDCNIIGICERLNESVEWLCRYLNWEVKAQAPRRNITRERPASTGLDPATRTRLLELVRLDVELYRLGLELFEKRRHGPFPPEEDLPPAQDFTFDQIVYGRGWYKPEHDGKSWFCWTGQQGQEACIELRADRPGAQLLRCRVAHVLTPQALQRLAVDVNGQPVRLKVRKVREGGFDVEGRVPAAAVPGPERRVRIRFQVDETRRPCDVNAQNADARLLGVALSRICLRSAN
jgi:hypothetical protein